MKDEEETEGSETAASPMDDSESSQNTSSSETKVRNNFERTYSNTSTLNEWQETLVSLNDMHIN